MSENQTQGSGGWGLGKKLLSAFVETDEPVQAQAGQKPAAAAPVIAATSVAVAGAQPAYDQAMLETLQKIVDGRKTAFTALMETANRMASIIPDEVTRLKAAWASVSSGRSAADVVQSIDLHISDLDGELNRFKSTVAVQLQQKSGTLNSSADQADQAADAGRKRIEALQGEIASLEQKIQQDLAKASELRQQAAGAEAEIRDVERRFTATADFLCNQLAASKTLIQTTI